MAFMRDEVFHTLVTQLSVARFRGRFTYHHYNEPLLNSGLERLVAIAKASLPDARHVIYTSGDHLTTARYEALLAAGVDAFVVTDHGGRSLTAPVKRATGFLAALRQKRVRLRRFGPMTSLFDRGGLVTVANPRHHSFCAYPAYELVVDVNGNVILCCNDFFGEYKFGNVLHESVVSIWTSPAMTQVRRRLRSGHFDLPICRACVGISMKDTVKPIQVGVHPRQLTL
jgi:2-deoxy-scyllo-inosamine dehydrogenase (SAM-dependent)